MQLKIADQKVKWYQMHGSTGIQKFMTSYHVSKLKSGNIDFFLAMIHCETNCQMTGRRVQQNSDNGAFKN